MFAATRPFNFILFGASGNLAKLKIYPALYVLALKKRLPEKYALIGFARTEMNDESFRSFVTEAIREHVGSVNEEVLQNLLSHTFYSRGNYNERTDFEALDSRLDVLEQRWERTVRVAYLSIPPVIFDEAIHNLCAGNVHCHTRSGDFRCIVEKPAGHDLQSFKHIQQKLTRCFRENEIYLLDHFLGKEAVRNAYYLRFANPILEHLLKNTLIHHVEITAAESVGLEGRAGYFDQTGTLRDMFQSHLLQIASLLTMRLCEEEETFIESRESALAQLYIPPANRLNDVILQGQYVGYTKEEDIPENSRTNTFVALKLMTRASHWEGVPFYLRSGKKLSKKETRISIAFQESCPVGKGGTPNRLDIILQGEAGMRIHLQTKIGGTEPAFRPLVLADPLVCVGDCLPEHGLLLLETINGKKQWFLEFEEVRSAWRLIDPLQAYCEKKRTKLHSYPADSMGPKEAYAWIEKDGAAWFDS